MTPQNTAPHLALFCLHRDISSKNEIKFKTTPDSPINESGLVQMIVMYPNFAFPGLEVKSFFSSSAQLTMKFQLFINTEIVKISGKLRFKTQNLVIYSAHKC